MNTFTVWPTLSTKRIEVRQKCNCVFGDGRYGCVVVWNDKNGKDCVCDHNPKGRNLRSVSENLSSVETKLTFSARCREKPISRRVSRGLREALWIFVGVGFFLGGKVAMLSPAFRVF